MSPVLSISYSVPSTSTRMLFFFNDTATTEIYTLSLHDALPICSRSRSRSIRSAPSPTRSPAARFTMRSEEHTSELQSRQYLVCRLLLEKKKPPPWLSTCAAPSDNLGTQRMAFGGDVLAARH